MARYSEEILNEVRQSNDIVDVISQYVHLKRSGRNYFGLCPFHNEKSPSFSVSPDKQIFHCFGCGVGGNVITFVSQIEGLNFIETVQMLAERANIQLPTLQNNGDTQREILKDKVYKVNEFTAEYYHQNLYKPQAKMAQEYVKKRQLTNETLKSFRIGFSGKFDELYQELKKQGFQEQEILESGLVNKNERGQYIDRYRNRLMFPICDARGRVIAFGGRVLDDSKPKYINSPENIVYSKGRHLFGLNVAKKGDTKKILIVEGYMDVIALHQAGFTNAVASLGTAFTSQHCSLLKRYTDLVYLCYDSDEAGVKAALRAIPMLKEADIQVKVIDMRPYKDPDEFMKGLSPEEFADRIKHAKNSFFYEIDHLEKQFDMNDPESKTRFMNEAALKCLSFENEIERSNYMEAFAREYQIRLEDFRKLVAYQSAKRVGIDYDRRREKRLKQRDGQPVKEDGIAKRQGIFLTWLCNDLSLFEKTKNILSEQDFVDEPYHQVAVVMYEQYRTTKKVEPAKIISQFDSKEEQSLVAGLFNKEIVALDKERDQEKALNEVVRSIKSNSIDYRSRHTTDMNELQKIIEEKRNLQHLQISL